MKKIYLSILLIVIFIFSSSLCAVDYAKEATHDDTKNTFITVPQNEIKTLKQETIDVKKYTEEKKKEEFRNKLNEVNEIDDNKEWFIAYKDLIYKYAAWEDAPETVYDYFTEDEVRLICRVVETETYDQDFDSKCNVASVVFNRIESEKFGDTVEEIIKPGQFVYGRESLTEDTILAVMYAFEIGDTAQGALYFHSNEKTDKFCGRSYIFTDEAGHHFY